MGLRGKNLKNNSGFFSSDIIIYIVGVALVGFLIYSYRDKLPNFPEIKIPANNSKNNSSTPVSNAITQPTNSIDTKKIEEEKLAKEKALASKIEALDKEYFELYQMKNFNNPNKEIIKNTIKKLRDNQSEYQKEMNTTTFGSSSCVTFRSQEYQLRNVEEIFVYGTSRLYAKEIWLENFTRERLDLIRDYEKYCQMPYEKLKIKIQKFD